MATREQEVQERLGQDPEELRRKVQEEIARRAAVRAAIAERMEQRPEAQPDTTPPAPPVEPQEEDEERAPDHPRGMFGPTDVDRAMFGESEDGGGSGLVDALGSLARGVKGVGRLAARAVPGGEPLIQPGDEDEIELEAEPEEPEEPAGPRGMFGPSDVDRAMFEGEEFTNPGPKDFGRGVARGLSEVGFRTAIGTSELVGADKTAANLRADRELTREVYGEAETGAGLAGDIAAQLIGEGALFMTPGVLATRLGRMSGVITRTGQLANGASKGGRFLQLLAAPQGATQRAVQTFLTGAPLDLAISQAGPEESMAGAIGALTNDQELVSLSKDPIATGAFEVVSGFVAGEILGEVLGAFSRGSGTPRPQLEELGRVVARAEVSGATIPEEILSQIDELPTEARRKVLEAFAEEQDRLNAELEAAPGDEGGVPRETPEDAAGAPRGAPEGEGQGVGRGAQEATEEPGPRPESEPEEGAMDRRGFFRRAAGIAAGAREAVGRATELPPEAADVLARIQDEAKPGGIGLTLEPAEARVLLDRLPEDHLVARRIRGALEGEGGPVRLTRMDVLEAADELELRPPRRIPSDLRDDDFAAPDVDPERQRIQDLDDELMGDAVSPEEAVAGRAPEPTPEDLAAQRQETRRQASRRRAEREQPARQAEAEKDPTVRELESEIQAAQRGGNAAVSADHARRLQRHLPDDHPVVQTITRQLEHDPEAAWVNLSGDEAQRALGDFEEFLEGRASREARRQELQEAPAADRQPWRQREVQPPVRGRTQRTLLPGDGSKVETEFAVVEAGEVRASHTPEYTQRAPEEFPPEIQGRAYHGARGRQAREFTEDMIAKFDPDRAFDPTISIAEGPPTITRSGINVAGNGRTIAQQRMYQTQPDRARQLIKDELIARAEEFGVDPEAIRGMDEPMLVRRVADESVDELDIDQLRAINQKSDVSTGKAKDVVSEAASRAEQMRSAEGALRHFAETIPEDATIRSYLGTKAGVDFLRRLVDDGVIAGAERARFIDANTGAPTAEGKSMVEQIMFAAAVGDPDVLARAPAGVLRKLDTALPALIRANRVPDFNLEETLTEALDLLASARATDQSIDDLVAQVDIERPAPPPEVVQMARFLDSSPKNSRAGRVGVKDAFREYADEAEAFARQTESDDLFGFEPRGPDEARGRFAALTPPEDAPAEAFARSFGQSSSRTFRDLSMTAKGEKSSVISSPVDENVRRDPSTTRSSISSPSQSQTPSASELRRSTSRESGGGREAIESPGEGTGSTRKIASEGFPVDDEGRVVIPPMSSTEGGARRLELTERYERELGGFETIEEDFRQPLRELPERQPSPETTADLEEEASRHLIHDQEAVDLAGRMYAQLEQELPQLRRVLEDLAGEAGEVVIPGLKPPRSFWNKVKRKMRNGRNAVDAVERVGDVGRGSVVFESLEEATNLVDNLRRRGVIVELDDWHAQADRGLGYGAHHLQLELRSGVVVEIQVQTRQVWRERAYYGGHDIYDLLESKERISATTTRGQRQAWSMLHYARDGYADAMEAALEGRPTPYPRHSMQWDEELDRWVIKTGAEFEDGRIVETDGQTPYAARRLLEEVESRREPVRQFQTGRGPASTAHALSTDLFGNPVEGTARQGDLLGGGGPQGRTEALENARATVSQLEGKVARGAASASEVQRLEDARRLIRSSEGRGLDAEEVSARARERGDVQEPDDTGDLFGAAEEPRTRPLAPTEQASEKLPSSGEFYDKPEARELELVPAPEIIEELGEAIGDVMEGLGLKVGVGKLPRGAVFQDALGTFDPKRNVARQINIADVPVFGHEAGHAMHKVFFGTTPKGGLDPSDLQALPGAIRGELEDLGEGISGGGLTEGWAEVWRRYLDNPDALAREAPNTLQFVEERLSEIPALREAWDVARRDWTAMRESSAQARVGSAISVGDRAPSHLSIEDRWARARTAVLDDMEPIRRVVQKIRDAVGIDSISEEADTLARLVRGSVGVANHFLEHGVLDFRTLRKVGPSLKDVLEPVTENLDEFRRYMVAKRAQELHERDILTGLRKEDVDAVVEQLDEKYIDTFSNTFARMQDWNQGLLGYLRDSGVISGKSYDAIVELNQSYVPFYRVIDEGTGGAGLGANFGHLFSPVKRIKGSGRTIIDPLESMVKNALTYTQIAQKQQVSRALAALAEKPGVGKVLEELGNPIQRTQFRVGEIEKQLEEILPGSDELLDDLRAQAKREFEEATEGMSPAEIEAAGIKLEDPGEEVLAVFRPGDYFGSPNTISVLQDGQRVWYEVDQELFDALNGLDREKLDAWARFMGAPARTLRAGATLAPEFLIRNPLRDQVMAFVQSEYGFVPGVDMAKGLFELLRKGEAYQQWISSGGYRAALTSLDRNAMQNNLRELVSAGGVANVIKHPLDALQALSALMEDASRMGEFINARAVEGSSKEGLQRAAAASREISVDFARHGAKTAALRHISAFWNARLQGYDRLFRAAKNNPRRFAAKAFGIITVPSLLEYAANRDDPDYWEQPQWKRDLFWMIKVGDSFVSIPKPFELGLIFGTLPVRIVDSALSGPGGDHELQDFLFDSLLKGESSGFIPQPNALMPLLENTVNYSFFLRRPIVPRSEEEVRARYQAGPFTSEVAQMLGRWSPGEQGLSPREIDNLLYAWTGGLGRLGTQAVDPFLEGRLPFTPGEIPPVASRGAVDFPGLRGVMDPIPGFSSESIERFYDQYARARGAASTLRFLERREESEAYQSEVNDFEASRLRSDLPRYRNVAGQLAELRSTVDAIRRAPDMTSEEKRDEIERLGQEARQIAQSALFRELPGGRP